MNEKEMKDAIQKAKEKKWNIKQIIKVFEWISNHKVDGSRIVAKIDVCGTGEILLYEKPLSENPAITIYVYGVFDVFLPTSKTSVHKRCWFKGQVIDYIKKNASNLLGGK